MGFFKNGSSLLAVYCFRKRSSSRYLAVVLNTSQLFTFHKAASEVLLNELKNEKPPNLTKILWANCQRSNQQVKGFMVKSLLTKLIYLWPNLLTKIFVANSTWWPKIFTFWKSWKTSFISKDYLAAFYFSFPLLYCQ